MPSVDFEGLAQPGQQHYPAPDGIQDGYAGFRWKNFGAYDTTAPSQVDKSGYPVVAAAGSGTAVGFNGGGQVASFRSLDRDADFDLVSAVIGAAWFTGMTVRFKAFDNGERVGRMTFDVGYRTAETVFFDRGFEGIDKVKIRTRGGTDADPMDGGGGANLAIDDIAYAPVPPAIPDASGGAPLDDWGL